MAQPLSVIAIGGSGALCLESLVHLCAMGQGPSHMVAIMIDADGSNKTVERVNQTLAQYVKIRSSLDANYKEGFFKTQITLPKGKSFWSPFENLNRDIQPELGSIIQAHKIRKDGKYFLDLLFTDKQLAQPLDEGFRGYPAIGSIVMQMMKDRDWLQEMSNNWKQESKLFIMGSIFGGTGAAGIPVVAKIASVEGAKVRKGAAILTPYFSLGSDPNARQDDVLKPNAAKFMLATAAALPHYNTKDIPLDSIYILGDGASIKQLRKYSPGGPTQDNPSHFLELVAALACLDFSNSNRSQGEERKFYLTSVDNTCIGWEDLPGLDREKMATFWLFNKFMNLYFIHSLRNNYSAFMREIATQHWFATTIEKDTKAQERFFTEHNSHFDSLDAYFDSYNKWVRSLHENTEPAKLIKTDSPIGDCLEDHTPPTTLLRKPKTITNINELNTYLNKVRENIEGNRPFSKFMDITHRGIEIFYKEWYRREKR